MQLHKIKQYSLSKLVYILIYRIAYEMSCTCDKIRLFLFHSRYKQIAPTRHIVQICNSNLLSQYLKFIKTDQQLVFDEANKIINGRIKVFGTEYMFNCEEDWLRDPVTQIKWSKSPFWRDASFSQEGCADVKYVLEINKLNHLTIVALAYYFSGDEKYILHVEKEIRGWIKCVPRERTVANKIVMDLGFRVINLVQVCLLCAKNHYFVENVQPIISGVLNQHKNQIWGYLCSRWFKSGNDNNHNVGELVGAYVAQRWLEKFDIKTPVKKYSREIDYLTEVLDKLIAPSGVYVEQSSNYTRVVLEFLFFFNLFRNEDTLNDFSMYERGGYLRKLATYYSDICYHGKVPNFGDNDNAQVILPLSIKKVVEEEKELESKRDDYPNTSQWLYKSQDKFDLFLFTRIGKFAYFVEGAFVHAHNDILSLIMCVKGYEVFIDKGCLFYNSGMSIREEYTSIAAHNVPYIEGVEMTNYLSIGYRDYPESEIIEALRGESECRFVGRLSYKNVNQIRELYYQEGQLLITDKIQLTDNKTPQKIIIPYLLSEKVMPKKVNNEEFELYGDYNTRICTMYFIGAENIEIVETNYAPHYALKRPTKKIVADSSIINSITIVTKILF